MVIQISIACAVLAFIGLVAYVILTLRKSMVTLGETNQTLVEVRNAVHGLTREASQLINSANQVTRDVKGKIETIDPLFESAHDVGEVIQSVTDSVKKAASAIGSRMYPEVEVPPTPVQNPQVRIKMKSGKN